MKFLIFILCLFLGVNCFADEQPKRFNMMKDAVLNFWIARQTSRFQPDSLIKDAPEFNPKSVKEFTLLFKKSDTVIAEQRDIISGEITRSVKLNSRQKKFLIKHFSDLIPGNTHYFYSDRDPDLSRYFRRTYMATLIFQKGKTVIAKLNYHTFGHVRMQYNIMWSIKSESLSNETDKFFDDLGFFSEKTGHMRAPIKWHK